MIKEHNGEIEFRVINNDGDPESLIIFTEPKCVFEKHLPGMPKKYIAQLVYDRVHTSIAIVKGLLVVVGGITYQPFEQRKFARDRILRNLVAGLRTYMAKGGISWPTACVLDKLPFPFRMCSPVSRAE